MTDFFAVYARDAPAPSSDIRKQAEFDAAFEETVQERARVSNGTEAWEVFQQEHMEHPSQAPFNRHFFLMHEETSPDKTHGSHARSPFFTVSVAHALKRKQEVGLDAMDKAWQRMVESFLGVHGPQWEGSTILGDAVIGLEAGHVMSVGVELRVFLRRCLPLPDVASEDGATESFPNLREVETALKAILGKPNDLVMRVALGWFNEEAAREYTEQMEMALASGPAVRVGRSGQAAYRYDEADEDRAEREPRSPDTGNRGYERYRGHRGDYISITVEVPPECMGLVIGKGGINMRRYEEEGVRVQLPPRGGTDIIITGLPTAVERAKDLILEKVPPPSNVERFYFPASLRRDVEGEDRQALKVIERHTGAKLKLVTGSTTFVQITGTPEERARATFWIAERLAAARRMPHTNPCLYLRAPSGVNPDTISVRFIPVPERPGLAGYRLELAEVGGLQGNVKVSQTSGSERDRPASAVPADFMVDVWNNMVDNLPRPPHGHRPTDDDPILCECLLGTVIFYDLPEALTTGVRPLGEVMDELVHRPVRNVRMAPTWTFVSGIPADVHDRMHETLASAEGLKHYQSSHVESRAVVRQRDRDQRVSGYDAVLLRKTLEMREEESLEVIPLSPISARALVVMLGSPWDVHMGIQEGPHTLERPPDILQRLAGSLRLESDGTAAGNTSVLSNHPDFLADLETHVYHYCSHVHVLPGAFRLQNTQLLWPPNLHMGAVGFSGAVDSEEGTQDGFRSVLVYESDQGNNTSCLRKRCAYPDFLLDVLDRMEDMQQYVGSSLARPTPS